MKQANIIKFCTYLVTAMMTHVTLQKAERVCRVPSVNEIYKTHALRPGREVSVYRKGKGWNMYMIMKIRGNEIDIVLTSKRLEKIAISLMRPYYIEPKVRNQGD